MRLKSAARWKRRGGDERKRRPRDGTIWRWKLSGRGRLRRLPESRLKGRDNLSSKEPGSSRRRGGARSKPRVSKHLKRRECAKNSWKGSASYR